MLERKTEKQISAQLPTIDLYFILFSFYYLPPLYYPRSTNDLDYRLYFFVVNKNDSKSFDWTFAILSCLHMRRVCGGQVGIM